MPQPFKAIFDSPGAEFTLWPEALRVLVDLDATFDVVIWVGDSES